MCRYNSGVGPTFVPATSRPDMQFFFRHPLLADYDYYWRIEPSIKLFCDIGQLPAFVRDKADCQHTTLSYLCRMRRRCMDSHSRFTNISRLSQHYGMLSRVRPLLCLGSFKLMTRVHPGPSWTCRKWQCHEVPLWRRGRYLQQMSLWLTPLPSCS